MKVKSTGPLKYVFIEWQDATRAHEWMDADKLDTYAKDDASGLICEGGWLICETPHYLVLAAAVGNNLNKDMAIEYNSISRIPLTWIRRRAVLFTMTDDGELRYSTHAKRKPRRSRRWKRDGG